MPKSLLFIKGAAMHFFFFFYWWFHGAFPLNNNKKSWVWTCLSIRLAEHGSVTLPLTSGQIYCSLCSHENLPSCMWNPTRARCPTPLACHQRVQLNTGLEIHHRNCPNTNPRVYFLGGSGCGVNMTQIGQDSKGHLKSSTKRLCL